MNRTYRKIGGDRHKCNDVLIVRFIAFNKRLANQTMRTRICVCVSVKGDEYCDVDLT